MGCARVSSCLCTFDIEMFRAFLDKRPNICVALATETFTSFAEKSVDVPCISRQKAKHLCCTGNRNV